MTRIFDAIPSQLQKHEKRFRIGSLEKGARTRDYANAFFWLEESRGVNVCYAATELFFCSNHSRVAEDRREIDFLVRKPSITMRHNISRVEVKSTSRYTLTSLDKCIRKYGNCLATPDVLHSSDLKEVDDITYLPLYMAGCF